jgi:hypothetical protein
LSGRLPFAAGADDLAGILFRNSSERIAWLQGLRSQRAKWQVRKNEYDDCKRNHGENCQNPGPSPR